MYKIRLKVPVNIRLQIFHSFVQSHLNFCLGIHKQILYRYAFHNAVMPGYVNYFYKDGKLPTGTKKCFTDYRVLTIHGIIASNALNFMHKA